MITIELRATANASQGMTEVEIFCDPEGLGFLEKQLEHLKSGSSHVHFMTPAWAGTELGEQSFGNGTILVNHLRITRLPRKAE